MKQRALLLRPPTLGRLVVTIFGDIIRSASVRRAWALPGGVFGDIDIDLRQAAMPSGELVITDLL